MQNQEAKKPYETPTLIKHQRLQKVTLGTVSALPAGAEASQVGIMTVKKNLDGTTTVVDEKGNSRTFKNEIDASDAAQRQRL